MIIIQQKKELFLLTLKYIILKSINFKNKKKCTWLVFLFLTIFWWGFGLLTFCFLTLNFIFFDEIFLLFEMVISCLSNNIYNVINHHTLLTCVRINDLFKKENPLNYLIILFNIYDEDIDDNKAHKLNELWSLFLKPFLIWMVALQ